MNEEESKIEMDALLDELHAEPTRIKQTTEAFRLSGGDLKQFLLDQSGQLIKTSIDCVNNYKELLGYNPDFKEAGTLAELIKAASTTIETLNKVYIQDERSKTAADVENIRANVKREISKQAAANNEGVIIKMTRKDLMNAIFNQTKAIKQEDTKIVDANVVDVDVK